MLTRVGLGVAICGLALLLLGGATAASRSGQAQRLPPPSFRPSAAWLSLTTGTSNPPLWEGVWAITAPLPRLGRESNLAALAPFDFPRNLRHLSRDAIYVSAQTEKRAASSREAQSAEWPLRLSRFHVNHQWDGQPAPNVQQRLRFVAVRDWLLDVRVYFATQHPSKRLLHEAQAELDRLRLPKG
jgi:hypothetical protein